jgi:hypothetical protein
MGIIMQILSLHTGEDLGVIEKKVTGLVNSGNRLLKAMEDEKVLEASLSEAEKAADLDRIFQIQKDEIKLAMQAFEDIKTIQQELFSLSDDEKRQIDDFILDAKRLLLEGVPEHEEKSLIEKLRKEKHAITQFFRRRH